MNSCELRVTGYGLQDKNRYRLRVAGYELQDKNRYRLRVTRYGLRVTSLTSREVKFKTRNT
jgi:hypothetical protein